MSLKPRVPSMSASLLPILFILALLGGLGGSSKSLFFSPSLFLSFLSLSLSLLFVFLLVLISGLSSLVHLHGLFGHCEAVGFPTDSNNLGPPCELEN